jgi:hypothetical protein
VSDLFPAHASRLRDVFTRLNQLPDNPNPPEALKKLERAFEETIRVMRHTLPTVQQVNRHLDALTDGMPTLNAYNAELTAAAIRQVRAAADVRDHLVASCMTWENWMDSGRPPASGVATRWIVRGLAVGAQAGCRARRPIRRNSDAIGCGQRRRARAALRTQRF